MKTLYAMKLNSADNVATLLDDAAAGDIVTVINASGAEEDSYPSVRSMPRGHKIALIAIAKEERIIKYGCPIGSASADIAAGEYIHTHNLQSLRGRGDLPAEV